MKKIVRAIGAAVVAFLKFFYYRIISLFRLCFSKQYYSQPSYFPEFADRRKSKTTIWWEQFKNVMKYGYLNAQYFLYGFDIKNFRNQRDYIDYSEFRTRRNRLNGSPNAPVSVLRNKYVFGEYCKGLGLPTPKIYGFIAGGKMYSADSRSVVTLDEFFGSNDVDVFCKLIDGECGEGVLHIVSEGGKIVMNDKDVEVSEIVRIVGNARFVVQQTITNQHEALSRLFPHSVNTMRVSTVYDFQTGRCEIFSVPVIRVGRGNNIVDNWAAGGLFIGIDDDGKLHRYGYYKPLKGIKADTHPDTNITFEGYQIPFYKEALEMVKRFHDNLPGIHSIGWDIAFTQDGPVFIEGNDNWEIPLPQVAAEGLRDDFERYYPKK